MRLLTSFLLMLFLGIGATINAQEFQTRGQADITFEKTEHDFGKIPQGEPVSYKFKLTNTGDGPLIIKNVVPSCGCTTPKWPEQPIKPGDTAYIKAVYDAKQTGAFNKEIRIHSNVPFSGAKKIYIKGVVDPQMKKGSS